MADYIAPPVEIDPDEIAEDGLEFLQSVIPGFDPAQSTFVLWVLTAYARISALNGEVASAALTEAFRYFGESLLNLPSTRATPASVDATITMADSAGYTIPAGLLVEVETGDGGMIAFETQDELTIDPGDTSGSVLLVAQEDGAHTSGLTGPARVGEVIDEDLMPITGVTLAGPTTNGLDDEGTDTYLIRLVAELGLLTRTPILPADFATRARHLAGSGRALALDGYDPVAETDDNERMVTVALRDDAGQPFSSGVKSTVAAALAATRETNFVVHVIDADYTPIDVDVEFLAYPGYDPAQLETAVADAINAYLSPATWGQPPFGSSDQLWYQLDTVRFQEVSAIVNNVEGVDHWTTLTICEGGGTPGTADVALDGAAPVAQPGAVTAAGSLP